MRQDDELFRGEGFIKDEEPWQGGWVHSRAFCLLADNASPMTYTGTNTWLVLGPSPEFDAQVNPGESLSAVRTCLVVDPGPMDQVPRIVAWCAERALLICAVVTTHRHADHTEGAQALVDQAGVEWLAWDRGNLREGWLDEQVKDATGWPKVEIVYLPGHSDDSVGLIVEGTMFMITGDVIFRHGPTVIKHPDGNLQDYLATLDKLEELVSHARTKLFLSAHGWPIRPCKRIIHATREHRMARLNQISAALDAGVPAEPDAIVDAVYEGLDPALRTPALKSVEIQLEYLLA
jgi:glyoxylase-like metal-dependent hydrolase (beta-lactamase superfamily II)